MCVGGFLLSLAASLRNVIVDRHDAQSILVVCDSKLWFVVRVCRARTVGEAFEGDPPAENR